MQDAILMQQVHGNNVVRVDSGNIGTTIPQCDALITNDPEVTLEVRVADCIPISIIDQKGRGVGLIHAGWRGLDNRIIEKCIRMMSQEFTINKEELIIKIGPHICVYHFEIKEDVASKFNNYPEALIFKGGSLQGGRTYLDLGKVAEIQLIALGIKKENITIDTLCTFEDKNLYSYRRDKTDKRNLIYLTLSPRG